MCSDTKSQYWSLAFAVVASQLADASETEAFRLPYGIMGVYKSES